MESHTKFHYVTLRPGFTGKMTTGIQGSPDGVQAAPATVIPPAARRTDPGGTFAGNLDVAYRRNGSGRKALIEEHAVQVSCRCPGEDPDIPPLASNPIFRRGQLHREVSS